MEKFSFLDILVTSWHLSRARARFYFFGLLIALPAVTLSLFLTPLENLPQEELLAYFTLHWLPLLPFLLTAILFTLYGKSNLIITLNHHLRHSLNTSFSLPQSLRPFKKAVMIDLATTCFFLLLLATLSLPSLVAFLTLGNIPHGLTSLGIFILLPIIVIGFFLRELIFFYFLLSPLRFYASLEASANFLVRFRSLCFLFGMMFIGISLLFTFSWNLVMLSIVALLQNIFPSISEDAIFFVGGVIAIAWYEVFRQALWFTFFTRLATPKDPAPTEVVVVLKEEASELPSV